MLDTQTWSPAPSLSGGPSGTPELSILAGAPLAPQPEYLIVVADDERLITAYRRMRHAEFVEEQQLFDRTDLDDVDADPRTVVLVAVTNDSSVIGGVRVAPCTDHDIGWWAGSRLVVAARAATSGVGAALINAACAYVESAGVLRFDACVQDRYARLFRSLGWDDCGPGQLLRGRAHREMRWPIGRIQATVDATKAVLGQVLSPLSQQSGGLGPAGFRGDDGVPVPGSDIIAACDAILPAMVERDPRWAGWCAVLVNLNDLAAMGARPVGLLDAVGAPTTAHLSRVIEGIAAAAQAWRTPVLGGHTQVGVPSALSVTALGTTRSPLPAGGGRVGDVVSVTADLGGSWRPGYTDRQWDSTSSRTSDELVAMGSFTAQMRPKAAKDVSMAGLVGTLGMLAEASGTGAELDVAAIPRPRAATMGAWLTCFPGFAMLTAGAEPSAVVPSPATSATCGRLTSAAGVRLVWPDGAVTTAVESTVTGLGVA